MRDSHAATMSIDDLTSTTRVFVSGLPPSFTSKDLRAFFGQKFNVTDAHVLPDRRIGFVGLADHESAKRSASYFNKSFIRMSKISVALARPVDVKRAKSGQAAPVSQRATTGPVEVSDKKPKDLKRKRHGLDDGEALRGQKGPRHENPSSTDEIGPSGATATNGSSAPPQALGRLQNASISEGADDAAISNGQPEIVTASDGDWLRGRTSRVLDLEGPREETPSTAPAEVPDVEPQANTTSEDLGANGSGEGSNDEEIKVPNGRLFLRNLAFEATDDDLQSLLRPFGNIEEVSLLQLLAT